EIEELYPDLTYYGADLAISTRYIARYGAFPLALCQLEVDENDVIQSIQTLNNRWELFPDLPPLRVLRVSPDADPNRSSVQSLLVHSDRFEMRLALDPQGVYLQTLDQILAEYNPDILVTDWGDSWLIPFLLKEAEEKSI